MATHKGASCFHLFIGLLLLPFLILGLGMAGAGLLKTITDTGHEDWPTTSAMISVTEDPTIAAGKENRVLHLDYEYEGQAWQSEFAFYKRASYSNNGDNVVGIIDLLPKIANRRGDQKLVVFINPKDPQEVRFHQHLPPLPYFMIIFGICFSGMAVLVFTAALMANDERPLEVECR